LHRDDPDVGFLIDVDAAKRRSFDDGFALLVCGYEDEYEYTKAWGDPRPVP
jgi:hypothetical protein